MPEPDDVILRAGEALADSLGAADRLFLSAQEIRAKVSGLLEAWERWWKSLDSSEKMIYLVCAANFLLALLVCVVQFFLRVVADRMQAVA